MGSKLLNGSFQLNVRMIAFLLLLILTVAVTSGTILGIPEINNTWLVYMHNIMHLIYLLLKSVCIMQMTIYNLCYCEGIYSYLMV